MIEQIRHKVRVSHHTKIAWLAMSGGVIVILGSWLPWFSLFAGLQPYRGIDLLNGRLLLGGGVFSIAASVWFLTHGGLTLRWGIGLFGFALLAFAAWSLLQLLFIYRELAADALMVARLGPGLLWSSAAPCPSSRHSSWSDRSIDEVNRHFTVGQSGILSEKGFG